MIRFANGLAIETISKPGAAVTVQRIILTPQQRAALTVSNSAAAALRNMVAWNPKAKQYQQRRR